MPFVTLDQLAAKVSKADLLRLFDEVGGLAGSRVGKIELSGGRATVEVPSGWEERLARLLDGAVLHRRRVSAWAGGADGDKAGADREHLQRLIRLIEIEREAEGAAGRRTAADGCRPPTPSGPGIRSSIW